MRPVARPERKGRPFWRDEDGFTTRDFKVVTIALTWLSLIVARIVLLRVFRETITSDYAVIVLRELASIFADVTKVMMVLVGGMAMMQFGSMWGGGYGSTMSPIYGDPGTYPPVPANTANDDGPGVQANAPG